MIFLWQIETLNGSGLNFLPHREISMNLTAITTVERTLGAHIDNERATVVRVALTDGHCYYVREADFVNGVNMMDDHFRRLYLR